MAWDVMFMAVGFAALAVGGWLQLRSTVVRVRADEASGLAEIRGERIAELERQVASLRSELAQLRGQVDALQALKAKEIAVEVAMLLREERIVG